MQVEGMTINYGIIATVPRPGDTENVSVVHFVGYDVEPDVDDFKMVYRELKTDKEFGLTEIDFDLAYAPQSVIDHIRTQMEQDANNEGE